MFFILHFHAKELPSHHENISYYIKNQLTTPRYVCPCFDRDNSRYSHDNLDEEKIIKLANSTLFTLWSTHCEVLYIEWVMALSEARLLSTEDNMHIASSRVNVCMLSDYTTQPASLMHLHTLVR